MTHIEFMDLHANCVRTLGVYVVQATKTTQMLSECTANPPTAIERINLASQGIVESDAHLTYLGAKSILYKAAVLGYGSSN